MPLLWLPDSIPAPAERGSQCQFCGLAPAAAGPPYTRTTPFQIPVLQTRVGSYQVFTLGRSGSDFGGLGCEVGSLSPQYQYCLKFDLMPESGIRIVSRACELAEGNSSLHQQKSDPSYNLVQNTPEPSPQYPVPSTHCPALRQTQGSERRGRL